MGISRPSTSSRKSAASSPSIRFPFRSATTTSTFTTRTSIEAPTSGKDAGGGCCAPRAIAPNANAANVRQVLPLTAASFRVSAKASANRVPGAGPRKRVGKRLLAATVCVLYRTALRGGVMRANLQGTPTRTYTWVMKPDPPPYPVPAGTDIGHVHLKVSDIEKSLAFYCGVLGFELTTRFGAQAAFISAGGYHHHIGLNTWESRGGSPPPPGRTGLFHAAIRYPTRRDLALALRRVLEAGIQLQGAADHGVSEALYLADPDHNGLELYWDRPREQWPRGPNGEPTMYTDPLDLEDLLRTAVD